MKKLLSAWLALCLLAAVFTGCSPKEAAPSSQPESSSSQVSQAASQPYQIGLVQYLDHAALNTAREAFMSRLEEWGCGEEMVKIDYQNAGGDASKAVEICDGFVEDGVDMLVAIATPAAQAAISAAADSDVTVVFAGVSDVETLGLEEGAAPSEKITGAVSPTPVESLIDLALQADPDMASLGLLYDPAEANSLADVERAKAYCAEKGLTAVEAAVEGDQTAENVMASLAGKVDAVFTPADSTVASQAEAVAQAAKTAGLPWYTGADTFVESGALAAMGFTQQEMGQKAADMAVELILGGDIADVPVYTFSGPQTFVNQTTLSALESLSLPEETLQAAYIYQ